MQSKRAAAKRLLRRRRGKALEQSYERLKAAMYTAALFTTGAVTVMMALQLLGLPSPSPPATGPLQQPILRHYALLVALIPAGFLGATFSFRFLAHPPVNAASRLLLLGGLFAVACYFSFTAVIAFLGVLGGIGWVSLLAVGLSFAAALLPSPGS